MEDVIVEIHTDTGAVGYGEAPPTGVITGDTTGAIIGAIRDHIAKTIIGRDVDDFEDLMIALNACIQKNTSAKAAVDMALWDLYGQLYKIPVYKLMGGAKKSIVTDITISVNDPEEMVRDALNAIDRGYDCLKVKVGKEPEKDIARLSAIRGAVPKETCIRIDANQGWTPKEAVRILNGMQEKGLDLEFVEQPVKAHDFEVYGVECMIGCMLEAKISVNAAVHLACAKQIITRVDLDGPVLCSEDPILGGAVFNEKDITVSNEPGLGIKGIEPGKIKYLD